MLKRSLLGLIVAYQKLVSPLFGARCRFYPSCSEYARQALQRYGPLKGVWLSLKRLIRCGPWSKGGVDPLE